MPLEGGGVAGAGAELGGERVVEKEVEVPRPRGVCGAAGHRARDGRAGDQQKEASDGEQDDLLEAEALALALVGLHEKPHRGPLLRSAAEAQQEVDEDRERDGGDGGRGEEGVREGHEEPRFMRERRRARKPASDGPSHWCVLTAVKSKPKERAVRLSVS